MSHVEFKEDSLHIAAKWLDLDDVCRTLNECTDNMSQPRPDGCSPDSSHYINACSRLGLGSKKLPRNKDTRERQMAKHVFKRKRLKQKSELKKTQRAPFQYHGLINKDNNDSRAMTNFRQTKRWKKTDLLGPLSIQRKHRNK